MQVSDINKSLEADDCKKIEDWIYSSFVARVECHGGFAG